MSQPDNTTLYLPSLWTKRFPPQSIASEYHLKICREYSDETLKQIKCKLNVKYGPDEEHVYDVFGIDLDDSAPIFIFIHGGYWQEENYKKDLYWFVAKNLYRNGIKTIFIEYQLCPKVSLHVIFEDIHAAMKHCLKYAESCNTRGIHLAGHSAGSQLVAELFENFIPDLQPASRDLFKSAFLVSGVYDLVPLIPTTINIPLKLDELSAKAASPLRKKIRPGKTIFHVITTQYECPALFEQSKQMNEHLIKSGGQAVYMYLENTDHFDVIENLFNEDFELTKYLVDRINKQ